MDWELRYQAGDTPWDKGEASPGLVEYLEKTPVSGEVLVPGCGSGHDVRALTRAGARAATDIRVTGLDFAPSAIEWARSQPSVGNEQYVQGDFFELPESLRDRFDWVVEHTCFCAIDLVLRPAYVESVVAALKPGGQFLAVFYMTPDQPEGPPHGSTAEQLDQLFGPYFDCVEDWVPSRAYPKRVGKERMRLMKKRS